MDLGKMDIDCSSWVVVIIWQKAVISLWNITLAHEQSLYHQPFGDFLEEHLQHSRSLEGRASGSDDTECDDWVVAPGSGSDKFLASNIFHHVLFSFKYKNTIVTSSFVHGMQKKKKIKEEYVNMITGCNDFPDN